MRKEYYIKFEKGVPTVELREIGTSEETGTSVRFKADPEIFKESTTFEYDILANRLRELAYLNRNLRVTIFR